MLAHITDSLIPRLSSVEYAQLIAYAGLRKNIARYASACGKSPSSSSTPCTDADAASPSSAESSSSSFSPGKTNLTSDAQADRAHHAANPLASPLLLEAGQSARANSNHGSIDGVGTDINNVNECVSSALTAHPHSSFPISDEVIIDDSGVVHPLFTLPQRVWLCIHSIIAIAAATGALLVLLDPPATLPALHLSPLLAYLLSTLLLSLVTALGSAYASCGFAFALRIDSIPLLRGARVARIVALNAHLVAAVNAPVLLCIAQAARSPKLSQQTLVLVRAWTAFAIAYHAGLLLAEVCAPRVAAAASVVGSAFLDRESAAHRAARIDGAAVSVRARRGSGGSDFGYYTEAEVAELVAAADAATAATNAAAARSFAAAAAAAAQRSDQRRLQQQSQQPQQRPSLMQQLLAARAIRRERLCPLTLAEVAANTELLTVTGDNEELVAIVQERCAICLGGLHRDPAPAETEHSAGRGNAIGNFFQGLANRISRSSRDSVTTSTSRTNASISAHSDPGAREAASLTASVLGAVGLRRLPCGHCFHRGCGDRWLRQSPRCPLCRRNVLVAAEERRRAVLNGNVMQRSPEASVSLRDVNSVYNGSGAPGSCISENESVQSSFNTLDVQSRKSCCTQSGASIKTNISGSARTSVVSSNSSSLSGIIINTASEPHDNYNASCSSSTSQTLSSLSDSSLTGLTCSHKSSSLSRDSHSNTTASGVNSLSRRPRVSTPRRPTPPGSSSLMVATAASTAAAANAGKFALLRIALPPPKPQGQQQQHGRSTKVKQRTAAYKSSVDTGVNGSSSSPCSATADDSIDQSTSPRSNAASRSPRAQSLLQSPSQSRSDSLSRSQSQSRSQSLSQTLSFSAPTTPPVCSAVVVRAVDGPGGLLGAGGLKRCHRGGAAAPAELLGLLRLVAAAAATEIAHRGSFVVSANGQRGTAVATGVNSR